MNHALPVKDSKANRGHKTLTISLVLLSVALVVLIALLFIMVQMHNPKESLAGSGQTMTVTEPSFDPIAAEDQSIIDLGADAADPNFSYLPTPLIAEYAGIEIHSPISCNNLTEVAFHRASYAWSLPLTSLMPEADLEEVAQNKGTDRPVASEQPVGDVPLDGEALILDRADSLGEMNTSIDVGAVNPGVAVYAPIDGIVVLVKAYDLYGEWPDYEIHIQMRDHPELDFILLHVDDVSVQAGDRVVAGVTRIAAVRDLGDVIPMQLSNFTEEGDRGNHTHFQINDTTFEGYDKLEGALDIFSTGTAS